MRIVPKSARPGFVSTPRSRKCLARHPRRSLRAGLSRYGRRQERARVRNPGGTAWTCEARRPWSRGASSGIGHATAHALAAQGATLALSGRNVARLEELADLIASHGHVRPVVLAADLSKRGAAESLAVQAVEALGHIDVLINNPAAEGVGVLRRRRRRRGFA